VSVVKAVRPTNSGLREELSAAMVRSPVACVDGVQGRPSEEPCESAAVMRRPCCQIGPWPQPASGVQGSASMLAFVPAAGSATAGS